MRQEKKRRKKKKRFSAGQKAGILFLLLTGIFLVLGITVGAAYMVMNHSGFSAGQKAGILFLLLTGIFLVLGITVGAAYMVMNHSGQNRLAKKQEAVPAQMQQETESQDETQEQLEAGSIRYQGKVYTYKKDILTFLFMGIDKTGEVKASSNLFKGGQADALFLGSIRYQGKVYTYKKDILTFLFMGIDKTGEVKASSNLFKGGQADALFLAALDPQEKKISIIGINRDTMTPMDVFDKNGLYAGRQTAQIALSHAYGEGMEESCENTVKAVSELFYGLPIHGESTAIR